MAAQRPVNESLQAIDLQTLLVGDQLLLSRSSTAFSDYLWRDECGFFYNVIEAPKPPPATHILLPKLWDSIKLVYDAGGVSAVWEIGNAILKVKDSITLSTTREHITLARVKALSPSFTVPDVLYHGEWAGRQYLVLSKLGGQTLTNIWPKLDDATKRRYVDQIVEVCNELGKLKAGYIGGLDGNELLDPLLIKSDAKKDFSHKNLMKSCTELGMDCSTFVFSHCDLGPGNIIIDPSGSLGIIDWEMAGYVPIDWVRTRFCISGGLDLPGTGDERVDWRRRVQRRLSEEGYTEFADEWMAWWTSE